MSEGGSSEDSSSRAPRVYNWSPLRIILSVLATLLVVLVIEGGRVSALTVPVPFLLLYASVVASGGASGRLAGGLSGLLAAAYVVYAALIGFGPRTLTGGEIQVLLGGLLYVGTGLLLGRVRDQRDQYLENVRRHDVELEAKIKESTSDLRDSRDQLRLITDNLPVLIAYFDAEKRYRFANKACLKWHAYLLDTILGKTLDEVLGQEYVKVQPRIDRALAGEELVYVESVNYPDGVTRTIQATYVPHLGRDGNVVGFFSLVEDISELQQAEEALRRGQRMEAVGQLTGGVAHDFNNLLAVILGNVELLQDEIGDNRQIAAIDRAATRGAELTQRLLSFSRQQALQPQSINLTELILGLHELLGRTLGEPVKISIDVPEGVWPVTADPGQLENALLNLSINARDAMPDGGNLEIRCLNTELREGDVRLSDKVAAGDYVQIAVRDTGSGMPEGVIEHAFEPFYTTKDVGEGTGLGLSMVYGFALQSGGEATIESQPGSGTEVRIFLPRAA